MSYTCYLTKESYGEFTHEKNFILTGEPSGDKLASRVINDLKKLNQNVDYLSVGGKSSIFRS